MPPRLDHVVLLGVAGAGHDDGLGGCVLPVELPDEEGGFETVDQRHTDVHEDESEIFSSFETLLGYFEGLHAVVGPYYMLQKVPQAYLINHELQAEDIIRLIIHYKYFGREFPMIFLYDLRGRRG